MTSSAAWSQEVLAKLQLLRQPLQQALDAASQRDACALDGPRPESASSAAELAGTQLLLDQILGLPLLPTLNAWLLGYPAVYLVSASFQRYSMMHTKSIRDAAKWQLVMFTCAPACQSWRPHLAPAALLQTYNKVRSCQ